MKISTYSELTREECEAYQGSIGPDQMTSELLSRDVILGFDEHKGNNS